MNPENKASALLLDTNPFLKTEANLDEFINAWKCGTLPKSCWTHAAHVGVAAYFAFAENPESTMSILRDGIRHYNTCVGTSNSEESGYHETLTRFWATEVGNLVRSGDFATRLDAVRAAIAAFGGDKYRFRLFYSFDVVGNRRARREWIEPDLSPVAQAADASNTTLRQYGDTTVGAVPQPSTDDPS